jgi:hypothetical protein
VTPVFNHLVKWWPRFLTTCCVLTLCVVRKSSASWSTSQSWVFLTSEWAVQVQRWSPSASTWNFWQPQTASGLNVCQTYYCLLWMNE